MEYNKLAEEIENKFKKLKTKASKQKFINTLKKVVKKISNEQPKTTKKQDRVLCVKPKEQISTYKGSFVMTKGLSEKADDLINKKNSQGEKSE